MTIEINVLDEDGDVLATRSAKDFEAAEENLGKLEGWYLCQEQKMADKIKYGEIEEV